MKKLIYIFILFSFFANAQNNGNTNGNANGSGGNDGNNSPHVFKNNTESFVYVNLGNSFIQSCGITDQFMKDTINEAVKQMKELDNALRELGSASSACNSINSGQDPLRTTAEALGQLSKEDASFMNWKKHAASLGPQVSPELIKLIKPEEQIGKDKYNQMLGLQKKLADGETLTEDQQTTLATLTSEFQKKTKENALLYTGAQMGAAITNLVATGCLKELFSNTNSTPAAAKVLNTLGTFGEVGSNMMMNLSGIVPAMAPFALGIKLASAGFRAIGSLVAKRRPVNKQTFHRKTCALKNYLETRAKAKCINGCDEKVETIKKAIEESQQYKDAVSCKLEVDALNKNISNFIVDFDKHVKNLPTIQNIDNEPLGTGEFISLRNMIADDQNRLEKEMGLDGSIPNQPYKLSDLMRVDGGSEKQMAKYDYNKPPLKEIISKSNYKPHLKQQIDLMMSPAGMAMGYFCGNKDGDNFTRPTQNKFFKDIYGMNDQETNKDCEIIRKFASCRNADYEEGAQIPCSATVQEYAEKDYSTVNTFISRGTLNLLNTLNYHRLSNELGHPKCKVDNPSVVDCPAMVKFSVKDPITHAYARITSGDLSLGFTTTDKDDPEYANYSLLRKKIFERDHKVKVATRNYNDYVNLNAVTKELQSLQDLAKVDLAEDDGNEIDKKIKVEAEKKLDHCFGNNDNNTEIITRLNDGVTLGDPDNTTSTPGAIFNSNWQKFFSFEATSTDGDNLTADDSGNFGVTLSKILKGNSPWHGDDKIEGEHMSDLQRQTCLNLYCPWKASEEDYRDDKFKKSNFIKKSKRMRSLALSKCEDVLGEEHTCNNNYCQAVFAKVESDIEKHRTLNTSQGSSWNNALEELRVCIEE